MTRVGIVGATGYTALESIRILLRHPEVQITCITSREHEGKPLDAVHPCLRGELDLCFELFEPGKIAETCDFVFCCLPHGASAESVKQLSELGVKVIDFSADYRLSSLETYEHWYDTVHPDQDRFGQVPYGLPEFFREEIRGASVVANPGCFPTSAILGIVPLLAAGLIESDGIIVDSKTGVSGAGRKANLAFHYPECNESVSAYKVGAHRHQPEIVDVVQRCTLTPIDCVFTPHLVPMERGILSTIYTTVKNDSTESDLLDCLQSCYSQEPFVRVTEVLPATRDVARTNYCDLTVRRTGNRVVIISAIDNLIKGASGAAVQNFNLMAGFDESMALSGNQQSCRASG